MPRVEIEVLTVIPTGDSAFSPVVADATNDHYITGGADGRTMVIIVSTDGSPRTVEVVPSPTLTLPDGLTVNNLSILVPAGDTVAAGPFRSSTYKQDVDNTLWLNPSVSTTLEFVAYQLPLPS